MKYRKGGCCKKCYNKFPHQHLKFQKKIRKGKKNIPCVWQMGKKKDKWKKKLLPPVSLMAFYFSSLEGKKNPTNTKPLDLALMLAPSC